jgi:hypothetical protein
MMKIIGLILIVGALLGGGIILSDTIPGYLRNKERLARTHVEAREADPKLAALGGNVTERDVRHFESLVDQIRYDVEAVERRRNESLVFGGGAFAVLALGTVLFVRGRRRRSPATAALAPARA